MRPQPKDSISNGPAPGPSNSSGRRTSGQAKGIYKVWGQSPDFTRHLVAAMSIVYIVGPTDKPFGASPVHLVSHGGINLQSGLDTLFLRLHTGREHLRREKGVSELSKLRKSRIGLAGLCLSESEERNKSFPPSPQPEAKGNAVAQHSPKPRHAPSSIIQANTPPGGLFDHTSLAPLIMPCSRSIWMYCSSSA